jgi:uncharacterized protein (TIGR03435 family)
MTNRIAGFFCGLTLVFAQSFEVATVKPGDPGDHRRMFRILPGGRFSASNVTVKELIIFAYELKDQQLSGGPGWTGSETFNVEAKPESSAPPDQLKLMMRTLLADRFKLSMRRESKELSVYNLVIGKNGPKMTASHDSDVTRRNVRMGRGQIEAQQVSMATLADVLSKVSGRTVLDKTGLAAAYDLKLEWTPDAGEGPIIGDNPAAAPSDSSGPSLFTAIQEQLGLKLEAQKGPVDVFVIERVEKPSEN